MELIGSQTENNLRSAISGEAQAALLYWFFEKKARRDGFEELGDIFHEISENEKAHAKIYYDLLKCIGPSEKNLEASAESELHEHSKMYPQFAKTAKDEGFLDIAKTFEMVAQIEKEHEARFRLWYGYLVNNAVFSKGMETEWICANCGHRQKGSDAPEICPTCHHPKAFFKVLNNL